MSRQEFDIAVIGGGAAGLAGAIALARTGWDTALVGPVAPRADGRTVALMDGSLQILESIDAWQPLVQDSAPLATLTIIDDTGALLRAPPVS
ncbi:MAG: FAD-binding protein, partial [Alsobacter sp.]